MANLKRVALVQGVTPANAGIRYSSVRVRHADLSNNWNQRHCPWGLRPDSLAQWSEPASAESRERAAAQDADRV